MQKEVTGHFILQSKHLQGAYKTAKNLILGLQRENMEYCEQEDCIRFDDFIVITMKNVVFCDMGPCGSS
jgi:hypothetical protein